jgi:nucleoside-diphosphate-sugar epimerase
LKDTAGAYWISSSDHFVLGDLRDYHVALSACLKSKPDLVFHLADIVAGIDFVFCHEPFLFRSNMLINTNMFSAIQEARIERLVYVGTACSYPRSLQAKPGGIPLVEEQVYPADPESAYGWSKLMGEYEVTLMQRYFKIQTGVLRLHNVYGPRSILSVKRSQVIPSLIRKALRYPEEEFTVWGTGKQARDFVFVGDVVDALLRLPLRGMCQGPIQIASGREMTIAELASLIVKISGKRIPIQFDQEKPEGDGGRCGNFDRAKKILDWDVFTPIEEGLQQTYDWAALQIMNDKVNLLN